MLMLMLMRVHHRYRYRYCYCYRYRYRYHRRRQSCCRYRRRLPESTYRGGCRRHCNTKNLSCHTDRGSSLGPESGCRSQ